MSPSSSISRLGECPACEGRHTSGSGRPNGIDCRCGRHFHFGDDLWVRTDRCIVCPSCDRALSPLDFDQQGEERPRATGADRLGGVVLVDNEIGAASRQRPAPGHREDPR